MRFDAPALGYGIAILEEKCVFEGAPGKGPKWRLFLPGPIVMATPTAFNTLKWKCLSGGRTFPPKWFHSATIRVSTPAGANDGLGGQSALKVLGARWTLFLRKSMEPLFRPFLRLANWSAGSLLTR